MSSQETQDTQGSKLPQPAGMIEKAWEWRWALQFGYAVLFADIALLLTGQGGILKLSLSLDYVGRHFGPICVAICAFGLFVSLVIPIAGIGLRLLVDSLALIPGLSALRSEPPDFNRGEVFRSQLYDLALAERSDFLLNLCHTSHEAEQEAEYHREQVGRYAFGLLVLTTIDVYFPFPAGGSVSLVNAALATSGDWGARVGLIAIIGCLSVHVAWFSQYQRGTIYFPPLYDALEAKKVAAKAENAARMARWEAERTDHDR